VYKGHLLSNAKRRILILITLKLMKILINGIVKDNLTSKKKLSNSKLPKKLKNLFTDITNLTLKTMPISKISKHKSLLNIDLFIKYKVLN
jgi:hypothetical protein